MEQHGPEGEALSLHLRERPVLRPQQPHRRLHQGLQERGDSPHAPEGHQGAQRAAQEAAAHDGLGGLRAHPQEAPALPPQQRGRLRGHAADLQHAHGVGLAAVVEERVLLEDGPVDLPVHHELQLLGQRAERLDVLPVRAASLRVLVDLDEGDDAVAEAEGQVVLGDEATELLLLVHVAPSERDEPGHRGGDGADEGGEERHGQQDHDDREDALARGPRVDVRGRRRELRQ
mmetsp:Transcript_56626/g.160752  ORF Transcript_56626/g.160752 Transcript_56626/m.160752 type:complete len:231 (-) Transcript_56626:1184-1876(-)